MERGGRTMYVHGTAIVRASDGRRFYLLESGGKPDSPDRVSLVDRDAPIPTNLCDACGHPFTDGENSVTVDGVGVFHPACFREYA